VLPSALAISSVLLATPEEGTGGSATARMSHLGGTSASQLPPHTSLLGGIPALPAQYSVTSPFKCRRFGSGLVPRVRTQLVDRVRSGAYVDLKELLWYNISYGNLRPYTLLPLYQPYKIETGYMAVAAQFHGICTPLVPRPRNTWQIGLCLPHLPQGSMPRRRRVAGLR
jgi:hypothetical protein